MRRRRSWRGVCAAAVAVLALAAGATIAAAQEQDPAALEGQATLDELASQTDVPDGETSGSSAAETGTSWEGSVEPAPVSPPVADGAAAGLAGDEPDYVIGPADLVRVQVWRNLELSAEVPVRPDGRISVPLLGDVQAAGLTTLDLRDRIAAGLAEYIAAPDVTVIVTQVNSKMVFLVGEVARPTAMPLHREMRVLDAISVAGGFSPFANRRKIQILRPLPGGGIEEHKFNYNRFVKGKDPESNLQLQPGDTIVVPD